LIDAHCHLEQKDYDADRDSVIEKCRAEGLRALVTCSARPEDFDLTMQLVEKYGGFVFATVGVHPEYVKQVSEGDVDAFVEKMKANAHKIVAVGEAGLDYFWVKEEKWRGEQREQFAEFIQLSKELGKPVVVHARDAASEAVEILEREEAKDVLMHMFGANQLTDRVIANGWFVSLNTIVLRSKRHRKVARDAPLERLLLETDSPWLGGEGKRNDPTAIKTVAKEIAGIKNVDYEEVWRTCGKNAARFFRLPLEL
jgi:TatD DNase family protein